MDYWRAIVEQVSGAVAGGGETAQADEGGCLSPHHDWLGGVAGVRLRGVEELTRNEDESLSGGGAMLNVAEARQQAPERLARLLEKRPSVCGLAMDRPHIMGVLNVTPDSFSDGGLHHEPRDAVAHGLHLLAEGASILDVGGESTRPGAAPVSVEDELERVLPVIEGLRAETDAVISIDTRKVDVMAAAVKAGASMINDVSALAFDENALETAARLGVPVVLMHAQGTPETMQDKPRYKHVLLDVYDYLAERIRVATAAGIAPSHLIVDPGIGFGKSLAHNLALLDGVSLFHGLAVPVLLGCSRKRFIGVLDGEPLADQRLAGSVAGALKGAMQGAQILRVHDAAATRQALNVWFGRTIIQRGAQSG